MGKANPTNQNAKKKLRTVDEIKQEIKEESIQEERRKTSSISSEIQAMFSELTNSSSFYPGISLNFLSERQPRAFL